MTNEPLKTLHWPVLTTALVVLWLAGLFYRGDVPGLVRAAILSQLDYQVHCLSLGGMTAGPCEDAG